MAVFQPQQFGKYQLLDKIAVGGMAELYRAKLTGVEGFEKLIAIKKILPHLSGEANLATAFVHEAKLAAFLHHENIVQIYDLGSMEGEYFIAMEYLFGKDLRAVTRKAAEKKQPLGLENILYIAGRICAGLDYSHNLRDLQGKPLNIIHRDINPQNIFITYEGQVKIIDFGIAKAAGYNTTTGEGLIKGKLAYMSPEQANGQVIDHRSDIYSTGIILYELLTGKRMFEGDSIQIYTRVREALYEPPEKAMPGLPAKLYDILNQALAKDPEKRYQSCGEMLAELEECAYQLSYRPSDRNFAAYVKMLFTEELEVEELALWAKTQIFAAAGTGVDTSPAKGGDDPARTAVITATRALGAAGGRLWRLALVAGLVAVSFIFELNLERIPFTQSDREMVAYAIQPPASKASAVEAKIAAARAALEAGRFDDSVALFEAVLATDPASKQKILKRYVQALEGRAQAVAGPHPEQAKALLQKALALDPASVPGLSQLGFLYVSGRDYPRAIQTYRRVVRLAPRRPDAYFNLGYIYAVTQDYVKARQMYRQVVELAPSFLDEALFNLAMVQARLGEMDQCRKNLEQAARINPRNKAVKAYLEQLKQPVGKKS